MIILTAGHTGAGTGAQCATTQFDEGAETIWLRDRIAEILTNKYGLVVLIDNDTASLQLLAQSINDATTTYPEKQCVPDTPDERSGPQNPTSTASPQSVQIRRATSCEARERIEKKEELKSELSVQSVGENSNPENAHTNPNARGTETIVSDNATASLQLLTQSINDATTTYPEKQCVPDAPDERSGPQNPTSTASPQSVQIRRATSCEARERIEKKEELKSELSVQSVGENSNPEGTRSVNSVNQRSLSLLRKNSVDSVSEASTFLTPHSSFLIDLHFNAHTNPNARGTETIVSDDATDTELRIASQFAHITAQTLEIPLRCIKSESQTPHKRLAMLHLTPQSIILEVCFITSPEDAEAYRKNRHKLANKLAQTIAKLIKP